MRISVGLVRMPDVSVILWDRLPGRVIPSEPIPALAPHLAVEVLSPSNTAAEMALKRSEYFQAGVQLVWMVDPRAKTVRVYTSPSDSTLLRGNDLLVGADILPG